MPHAVQRDDFQFPEPGLAQDCFRGRPALFAAGAGIPVSFLAEPGSASKAGTGGMEDSACRNFRQRQQTLMWITETVLRHVVARAAAVRRGIDRNCEIHVYGDDIASPGMSEGGIIHGAEDGVPGYAQETERNVK